MEWIFSKSLKMFRYHDKYIIKFCFLIFLTLTISGCCWSLPPQILSEHPVKDILADIPIPDTDLSTGKPICTHKLSDGLIIHTDCPSENFDKDHLTKNISPSEEGTIIKSSKENSTDTVNTGISTQNVTSINTPKPICNHTDENKLGDCSIQSSKEDNLSKTVLQSNETASSNSSKQNTSDTEKTSTATGNAEIASLNDHSNKYTGGLDVDEKLNITSNNQETMGLVKNSSESNEKVPKTAIDQKGNIGNNNSNAPHFHNKDSASKKSVSTKAAGIAAGICVAVASLAYISLMVWRKISYKRYGNREMLLNEDDLGDIHDEDMRHFEAACIQIET